MARQVEADVVMDLNEQGQEQLGVDAPHVAHAAVDRQELAEAAGCLVGQGAGSVRCPSTPGRAWTASLGGWLWIFALLWPNLGKPRFPPNYHTLTPGSLGEPAPE